jgi:hypothetical protein
MQTAHSLTHCCSSTTHTAAADSPSPFDRCLDVLFVSLVLSSFDVVCTLVIDHTSFYVHWSITYASPTTRWSCARSGCGATVESTPVCAPSCCPAASQPTVATWPGKGLLCWRTFHQRPRWCLATSQHCTRQAVRVAAMLAPPHLVVTCCVATDMLRKAMQLQNCSGRCSC